MRPADLQATTALWRVVRGQRSAADMALFRSAGSLTTQAAASVYTNSYWTRQHGALKGLFPRTAALLGDQAFRDLVRHYLLACPSSHPELEWIGTDLPAFLCAATNQAWQDAQPIAAYEQALLESLLAPDAAACEFAIPTETFGRCKFLFSPSLRIIALSDAVATALGFAKSCADAPSAHLVIARPKHAVTQVSANGLAAELLLAAHSGQCVDHLLEIADGDLAAVATELQRWRSRGWLLNLIPTDENTP